MRKILGIINIAEATECGTLETDYKIQRKNLKRYEDSLKIFRVRISQNVNQMQAIARSIEAMHKGQSKSRKKTSELEYFMFNGVKVFGVLISVFSASATFYEQLLKRLIDVQIKIGKCLKEQKKKYEKLSEQHEKEIKAFASECYPQTSSILFAIGLVSAQKVTKKPDSFRETSIVEQSKRYSTFLNACLSEMEELKKEALEIGQDYYEAAKDMWLERVQSFNETLETFEVNQEEIDKIADETGRVLTDRSIKSNENEDEHPQEKVEDEKEENEPEHENGQGNEQGHKEHQFDG